MSISRQEVEKVSLLARLLLSESELETMTSQLADIVAYVDQFAQLDTENVEPMAHAIELSNVFAEDEVAASLTQSDALKNAPHHDGECYLVPAVLGDAT